MSRAQTLAWTIGGLLAAACVVAMVVCLNLSAPPSFLLVYLIGILLAVLGALVASKEPGNSVGWLMLAYSGLAGVVQLVAAYGYVALGVHHGAWPLGSLAAWMGAWIWTPTLGFLAVIVVRFPDGRALRFGRVVDWALVVGSVLFAAPVALSAPATMLGFTALPAPRLNNMLPYFQDPVSYHPPVELLNGLQALGIASILLSNVIAVAALVLRYRGARSEEQLQIKWFAYAVGLCAAAVLYGGVAWLVFGQHLYLAFTPLEVVGLTVPIAIGVAILRYRLYDIDLIINRTLVYGSLTAILGAVYASVITLLNRLFISVSGQKSDAAYVVTAFVVVAAASPVREWLQHQVDRRVPHASPASVLDQFRSDVDAVVSVIDVNRIARRLLDQAIEAFDAQGAAVYLHSHGESDPLYSRGSVDGEVEVEVALTYGGTKYGRLLLARRRGDAGYTANDRVALQKSADSVGEALALAALLGFKPLSRAR
ncbi:MAG TPA: hypothetical protein VFK22_00470 [Candidatus Dormibacteraeota bacterium]|nr:hypothetical protein [Candidatus Dormibacteraeota bacterium]